MAPILIEPGTKYFLSETLKQCNEKKIFKKHIIINFGLFCFFIGI